MEKVDLIIDNADIIIASWEKPIIHKGAIAIKNNKILDVDKSNRVKASFKAEKTIDGKGKMALPGFVNTHTHLYQTLMRGLGDDMKLFDWLSKMLMPTTSLLNEEDYYYGALIGAVELLKSGVTCTVDDHVSLPQLGLSEGSIRAVSDIGMRGIISRLALDEDVLDQGFPTEMLEPEITSKRNFIELYNKWHRKKSDLIQIWIGVGSIFTASMDLLKEFHHLSNEYNVGICTHFHETLQEVKSWKKRFGKSPIKYCYDLGFLNSHVLAAHCVWLSSEDIKILRKTDTAVSHNPVSNMYLASGVCPVPKLLANGICVSLGVDGAASNNNQDMFEVIKTTALLQKVATRNPLAISARKVLEMATISGAKAIGLENEIGSLEKGKNADIILIDLNQSNMVPVYDFISQLVYCAKSQNVDSVIIDGKIIMESRRIKTIDEDLMIEKTKEISKNLREKIRSKK